MQQKMVLAEKCHNYLIIVQELMLKVTEKKSVRCGNQGWQYDTVRLNFCYEVRYAGTVHLFCDGTGTVRWYGMPCFVLVRVRYGGTLFELTIPDFSHIAPTFCMQRQKTAEADAKCMN